MRFRAAPERRSELGTVAQRNPELLQFVVGEVRQDIEVDVILHEQPRVAGEAEFFEPLREVIHGDTSF